MTDPATDSTPRTDAQTYELDAKFKKIPYPCGNGDHVSAEFAREIERELNEYKERLRFERECQARKMTEIRKTIKELNSLV